MRRWVSVVLVLLLAGCVSYQHPTKTEAEFDQDMYECERDFAAAVYSDYYMDYVTRCMKTKGWST